MRASEVMARGSHRPARLGYTSFSDKHSRTTCATSLTALVAMLSGGVLQASDPAIAMK
jgi:hypothetical protein